MAWSSSVTLTLSQLLQYVSWPHRLGFNLRVVISSEYYVVVSYGHGNSVFDCVFGHDSIYHAIASKLIARRLSGAAFGVFTNTIDVYAKVGL